MTAWTTAFIALTGDRKAVTALAYGLLANAIFGVILVGFTGLSSGRPRFFAGFVAPLA